MNEEDLEKMAMNTINFTDEIVYRGFIDALSEDEYDFGAERWCMIAPLGEYLATTADGREVTEILAPEDFERIVMLFHDRQEEKGGVPLDRDHASMKKPLDRDTQAYGWIRDLRMMIGGASQYNGLYAKIEWTDEGRRLVLDKSYRFLSPVFTMDGEGHPTSLVNVALTNRPNFDLPPIFNSTGDDSNSVNTIVEEHSMDIEQLKNEIASKVVEELKVVLADAKPMTLNTDCGKEVKNEDSDDVSEKKETDEKTETDDKTEVETTEEKKTEVEEDDSEKKETDEKTETEKEDVITEDVLNTVPTEITTETNTLHQAAEWQNLHGEALLEWARKNPQCV